MTERRIKFIGGSFLIIGLLVAVPMIEATSAAQGSGATGRLIVLDEDGKLLRRSRYIRLGPDRVGIPAWAFQKDYLGFYVRRHFDTRQVEIMVPESDSSVFFLSGRRYVEEPSQILGGATRRYDYPFPVAQLHKGEFYIAAAAFKDRLPGFTAMKWEPVSKTLILQRHPSWGKFIKQALPEKPPKGYQ